MNRYIMLTRLSPDAIDAPRSYAERGERVRTEIKTVCPQVKWIESYAVLGRYNYVDIFDAPDNQSAAKVSMIIESFGHASVEVWPAMAWEDFKSMSATYRDRGRAAKVVGTDEAGSRRSDGQAARPAAERGRGGGQLDEVREASEESFPASDAPSWTGASASESRSSDR